MTAGPRPGVGPEVLEQYKLAVEMADRISARRGQANQFYLTLQSSLLGVPAVFGLLGGTGLDPVRASLIAVIGALTSITWWLQLRSYRDLNREKFTVINKMEADYFITHPFSDEWVELDKGLETSWRERYTELGAVERIIPVVFLIVNTVILVLAWR